MTTANKAARADVRVIDFEAPICGFDGKAIQQQQPDGSFELFTLKKVCVEAVSAVYEDEKSMSGAEKQKRGSLALAIYEDRLTSPTVEQIALLKSCIGKAYPPLVVMRAFQLLDPADMADSGASKLN